MVTLQGVSKHSDEPELSGALVRFKSKLLAHQEATNARLELMQTSLRTDMATLLADFRASLKEELKSLVVGSNSTRRAPETVPPDGAVHFGSVTSPVLAYKGSSPREESASFTHARSEGPPLLQLNSGGNSSHTLPPKSPTDGVGSMSVAIGLDNVNVCVNPNLGVNKGELGVSKEKGQWRGFDSSSSVDFGSPGPPTLVPLQEGSCSSTRARSVGFSSLCLSPDSVVGGNNPTTRPSGLINSGSNVENSVVPRVDYVDVDHDVSMPWNIDCGQNVGGMDFVQGSVAGGHYGSIQPLFGQTVAVGYPNPPFVPKPQSTGFGSVGRTATGIRDKGGGLAHRLVEHGSGVNYDEEEDEYCDKSVGKVDQADHENVVSKELVETKSEAYESRNDARKVAATSVQHNEFSTQTTEAIGYPTKSTSVGVRSEAVTLIHPRLLKGTKAQVHKLPPLNVLLATGAKVQTHEEANLQLQLQDYQFNADYYVLPLTGCEIVLGTSWLKTLGTIMWNFGLMRMGFRVGGIMYQLQGETKPEATVISCKSMTRLLRKEREAFFTLQAHHSAIGMTPFKALYGYEAPVVIGYEAGTTAVESVDEQLQTRDEILASLKRNLQVTQNRMKNFYDKHHSERSFEVGDWVYLKLQPYRQHSVQRRTTNKLAPRYYGPYLIEQKIGTVAYKLKLPATSKVHPVFHVSLLKKKLGDAAVITTHLPPDLDPHNPRWYPAAILEREVFKKNNEPVTKWLIKWLGAADEEATWEGQRTSSAGFLILKLDICLRTSLFWQGWIVMIPIQCIA